MFLFLQLHLHTEYTAKPNLILEYIGESLYFQVNSSATRQGINSVVPPWGAAVSVTGVVQCDTAQAGLTTVGRKIFTEFSFISLYSKAMYVEKHI